MSCSVASTIQDVRLDELQRGINIIVTLEGKSRKVIIDKRKRDYFSITVPFVPSIAVAWVMITRLTPFSTA